MRKRITLTWLCGHTDSWPESIAILKAGVVESRDCPECRNAKAEREEAKAMAAAEVLRIEARAKDPRSDDEIYQANVLADFADARRRGWSCE